MAKKAIQNREVLNIVRHLGDNSQFEFFLGACKEANLEVCKICLDAGIDINIQGGPNKEKLLAGLARSDTFTTEVGDWLIENGADINYSNKNGITALTVACMEGNFEAAKYFVDKGINIKYNSDRGSDLKWAVQGENYEIIKMLLDLKIDYKDTNWSFIEAVKRGLYESVKLFLEKGISPNFFGSYETPLHVAVNRKDIQMAKILLKNNAEVNAKIEWYPDPDGYEMIVLTPMDIAVLNKDIEMQDLLKSFGGIESSKEEKIKYILEYFKRDVAFSILKKLLES